MSDRPYSRHYHELVDDAKFADIYPDDHHYACWSRLLMLADQAWPASAHIPATARKASVAKLAGRSKIGRKVAWTSRVRSPIAIRASNRRRRS